VSKRLKSTPAHENGQSRCTTALEIEAMDSAALMEKSPAMAGVASDVLDLDPETVTSDRTAGSGPKIDYGMSRDYARANGLRLEPALAAGFREGHDGRQILHPDHAKWLQARRLFKARAYTTDWRYCIIEHLGGQRYLYTAGRGAGAGARKARLVLGTPEDPIAIPRALALYHRRHHGDPGLGTAYVRVEFLDEEATVTYDELVKGLAPKYWPAAGLYGRTARDAFTTALGWQVRADRVPQYDLRHTTGWQVRDGQHGLVWPDGRATTAGGLTDDRWAHLALEPRHTTPYVELDLSATTREQQAALAFADSVTDQHLLVLLLGMWLRAFASAIRLPRFAGVLCGEPGTYKSSLLSWCRNLHGTFPYPSPPNTNFEATTAAVEATVTEFRDIPVIVDDLVLRVHFEEKDAGEAEAKINRIARSAHDGGGMRDRRGRAMEPRPSQEVRTLVTFTAERLPLLTRSTLERTLVLSTLPKATHPRATDHVRWRSESGQHMRGLRALGHRYVAYLARCWDTEGHAFAPRLQAWHAALEAPLLAALGLTPNSDASEQRVVSYGAEVLLALHLLAEVARADGWALPFALLEVETALVAYLEAQLARLRDQAGTGPDGESLAEWVLRVHCDALRHSEEHLLYAADDSRPLVDERPGGFLGWERRIINREDEEIWTPKGPPLGHLSKDGKLIGCYREQFLGLLKRVAKREKRPLPPDPELLKLLRDTGVLRADKEHLDYPIEIGTNEIGTKRCRRLCIPIEKLWPASPDPDDGGEGDGTQQGSQYDSLLVPHGTDGTDGTDAREPNNDAKLSVPFSPLDTVHGGTQDDGARISVPSCTVSPRSDGTESLAEIRHGTGSVPSVPSVPPVCAPAVENSTFSLPALSLAPATAASWDAAEAQRLVDEAKGRVQAVLDATPPASRSPAAARALDLPRARMLCALESENLDRVRAAREAYLAAAAPIFVAAPDGACTDIPARQCPHCQQPVGPDGCCYGTVTRYPHGRYCRHCGAWQEGTMGPECTACGAQRRVTSEHGEPQLDPELPGPEDPGPGSPEHGLAGTSPSLDDAGPGVRGEDETPGEVAPSGYALIKAGITTRAAAADMADRSAPGSSPLGQRYARAIVTDGATVVRSYRGGAVQVVPHEGFPTLSALADHLQPLGVSAAWIDPLSALMKDLQHRPTSFARDLGRWHARPPVDADGRFFPWVELEGPGSLLLTFGGDWPWATLVGEEDPVQRARLALEGLEQASQALGDHALIGTPSRTGRTLAADCNRAHRRADWWDAPKGDYQALTSRVGGYHAPLATWRRPLRAEEQSLLEAGGQLYVFDKRSAYLTAAGTSTFPVGEPQLITAPSREQSRTRLWHVRLRWPADSPWDGSRLPPLAAAYSGEHWLWTTELRFLQGEDAVPEILAAVQWPGQHKVLDTWARRLWDARRALPPGSFAAEAIKAIYVATLGLLGREGDSVRRGDDRYRWEHRDWWEVVHAEAQVRQWAHIRALHRLGLPPVFGHIDALALIGPPGSAPEIAPAVKTDPAVCGSFREEWRASGPEVLAALQGIGWTDLLVDGKRRRIPVLSERVSPCAD